MGGPALVGFFSLVTSVNALAQECETDADCGHGFQCIHMAAGNSAVTGAGGSSMPDPECGDGVCDSSSEDIESCPEDCDTIQYCAVAECSSDDDCAEGYECGPEIGSNSATTASGGTAGSSCGDSVCGPDETNQNCPEDCRIWRECQPAHTPCESDGDCVEGFYCNKADSGGSNFGTSASSDNDAGSSSVSSDGASNGSDGRNTSSDAGESGTSSSTNGGDESAGASGLCWPEQGDVGSSSTNEANSSTSTGPVTSGSNEANGNASGSNGAGGGLNNAASDAASGSSSDGGGGSSGGDEEDEAGCSCSSLAAARSSRWFGALFGLGLLGVARKRRRA